MNDTTNLPEPVEAALAELLHAQLLLGMATAKRRPTADAPEVLAASKALVAVCDAVRAALAQQPAATGEPAAWMTHHDDPMLFPTRAEAAQYREDDESPIALYAAPQPAPARVPLHEDALYLMADECETPAWGEWYSDLDALLRFARAIEAAHGVAAAPTAQQEPTP